MALLNALWKKIQFTPHGSHSSFQQPRVICNIFNPNCTCSRCAHLSKNSSRTRKPNLLAKVPYPASGACSASHMGLPEKMRPTSGSDFAVIFWGHLPRSSGPSVGNSWDEPQLVGGLVAINLAFSHEYKGLRNDHPLIDEVRFFQRGGPSSSMSWIPRKDDRSSSGAPSQLLPDLPGRLTERGKKRGWVTHRNGGHVGKHTEIHIKMLTTGL